MDSGGNYDFTENAYLLLRAMQITSKCAVAIQVLRGSCDKQSMDFQNNKEIYGAGRIWPKEYWTQLANQLKSHDYITLKKLPLPYRPIQVISPKGIEWLKQAPAKRLILKAKPEILEFLKKKKKVVLDNAMKVGASSTSVRKEVNNSFTPKSTSTATASPSASTTTTTTTTATPSEVTATQEKDFDMEMEMEMSDMHLEQILLDIRAVLAENSDIPQHSVASQTAIKQMVEKKPMSIKEIKSYAIDGFSLAKIHKFASFFIDGIIKFMVSQIKCISLLI